MIVSCSGVSSAPGKALRSSIDWLLSNLTFFIPPDIVGGRNVFEPPIKNPPTGRPRIEALILAAEDRSPLMQARIGVLRSLNPRVERMFNSRSQRHSLEKAEIEEGRMSLSFVSSPQQVFCSFEGTAFLIRPLRSP